MYLANLRISNFRRFGEGAAALDISFEQGVTALIGQNDSGKTTIIDAIRYALLTRDQQYIRVQPDDFHHDAEGDQAREILIRCKLSGLALHEKASFVEYLTYESEDVALYVTWSAKRSSQSPGMRRWVDISVHSGADGAGPLLAGSVRELLSSAYLRPLRDAEREMSAGRGSRLSEVLSNVPGVKNGQLFEEDALPADAQAVESLSLLGLADYFSYRIKKHAAISTAEEAINAQYLAALSLSGDNLRGRIDIREGGTEEARLRQILERLELALLDATTNLTRGKYGLGSNNLLYMACELLLLGREPEGLPLLLIEEPEAHLHPQRQMRLMEFLNQAAKGEVKDASSIQVILTTHSPNLASKLPVEKLILLDCGRAFTLKRGETKLEAADYHFLARFLDVTKASLFFAHGIIIVEGDSEAILLPTLAQLLGWNLAEQGVSIINVGGKGLRRFSRIFQRKKEASPTPSIPVACITDLDVMPDCAPEVLGLVQGDNDERWNSGSRRWKALRHLGGDEESRRVELRRLRERLQSDDGQKVRTFVADHWTLEYDLAYCGLAEEVFIAARLAVNDAALHEEKKQRGSVEQQARKDYQHMKAAAGSNTAKLSTQIYKVFYTGAASKTIAAQYLAELLSRKAQDNEFDRESLKAMIPCYLQDAILHSTSSASTPTTFKSEG